MWLYGAEASCRTESLDSAVCSIHSVGWAVSVMWLNSLGIHKVGSTPLTPVSDNTTSLDELLTWLTELITRGKFAGFFAKKLNKKHSSWWHNNCIIVFGFLTLSTYKDRQEPIFEIGVSSHGAVNWHEGHIPWLSLKFQRTPRSWVIYQALCKKLWNIFKFKRTLFLHTSLLLFSC